MTNWAPMRGPGGKLLQGALPKQRPTQRPFDVRGLVLKGVVVASYVYDSPASRNPAGGLAQFNGVYCDVLCYGKHSGLIPRVVVPQGSGVHEGEIWRPRAARMDTSGLPLDPDKATNPLNLDGDHVMVGFLEGDPSQPYVAGMLPHPASDIGHSQFETAGRRLRLVEQDGEPRLIKHRGAFWGVTSLGNFIIDLSEAHVGNYEANGEEPFPAETGVSGNFELRLPANSTVEIKVAGGANLKLEAKDGNAKLTLGNGAVSLAVAEHLEALYTALKATFDSHTHTYLNNVPTPPVPLPTTPPLASAPGWDSNIVSSKLKLPDT